MRMTAGIDFADVLAKDAHRRICRAVDADSVPACMFDCPISKRPQRRPENALRVRHIAQQIHSRKRLIKRSPAGLSAVPGICRRQGERNNIAFRRSAPAELSETAQRAVWRYGSIAEKEKTKPRNILLSMQHSARCGHGYMRK